MKCKHRDDNGLCHSEGADGLYECMWFDQPRCPGFEPAQENERREGD